MMAVGITRLPPLPKYWVWTISVWVQLAVDRKWTLTLCANVERQMERPGYKNRKGGVNVSNCDLYIDISRRLCEFDEFGRNS
ncbi:hypothetical protein [Palleniella muris]|uniref:hypothetical protein n=1 Tax=Palleniella muris TaxID=3038145 RepID=UPI001093BE29|nr:hypothetical protein [Palleniella muris]